MRYCSYAFTEQGIAMLASVLKSARAIQVNIQIMRTFTKLREMLATNTELREKIYDLRDMLEYIKKNVKPRPHLDVVKWMEKHGR